MTGRAKGKQETRSPAQIGGQYVLQSGNNPSLLGRRHCHIYGDDLWIYQSRKTESRKLSRMSLGERGRSTPSKNPLEVLDRLNPTIAELTQAIQQEAEKRPAAQRLNDPSRSGATALAFLLNMEEANRTLRAKSEGSKPLISVENPIVTPAWSHEAVAIPPPANRSRFPMWGECHHHHHQPAQRHSQ